ncbi:MAG: 16S rRNA (cytosine(967)-C(5))-methyltransferase RsmB [Eubacteriales bacterium]|nr:16S rRNA (cytosine(967)-C(5))-methyltransferase RsmB [Eubacteriales bacterium]MDY3332788.1 16S rRNA (cytosine(967)-C(5))-methyltransferase RsmB [Gallibacter sp.]
MDRNRQTAYMTLLDIESKKQYSNISLNSHINKMKPDNQGFVRELVYGVLENKILLDYIIKKYIKGRLKDVRRSDLIILRMGIYQILRMDSVPAHAAVDESIKLARKYSKGRHGFINAVLRSYIRDENGVALPDRFDDLTQYLSVKYSINKWIVDLWIDQYGEDFAEELIVASNERPPLTIRTNLKKIDRDSLCDKLNAGGYLAAKVEGTKTAINVKGSDLIETDLYKEGYFSIQDEASQKLVDLLTKYIVVDDKSLDSKVIDNKTLDNITFIDLCSAPGGKSFGIYERFDFIKRMISCDFYSKKIELMKNEASRLGHKSIEFVVSDATCFNKEFERIADCVIVDVPCSGLGVARRRPEIKYKKYEEIKDLPKKQLEILKNSSKYVKDNGIILYSTCTLNNVENCGVLDAFLEQNLEFVKLEEVELFPNIDRTDGFYICIIKKRN